MLDDWTNFVENMDGLRKNDAIYGRFYEYTGRFHEYTGHHSGKLDLKNLDLKFWTPFWTPNAKHGRMMQYMDHNLDVICKKWTNHWTIVVKHGLLSWTSIVYYGRLLQIMDFAAKNVDDMI